MNTPTKEQIDRLPAWARAHIEKLSRERDTAISTLNDFQDADTPSPVYYEELVSTGERTGPSFKRRYIQTDRVEFSHMGVNLSVYLPRAGDGRSDTGIELKWSAMPKNSLSMCALVPTSFQAASIVAKENIRP